jgi:hypothetical protein
MPLLGICFETRVTVAFLCSLPFLSKKFKSHNNKPGLFKKSHTTYSTSIALLQYYTHNHYQHHHHHHQQQQQQQQQQQ